MGGLMVLILVGVDSADPYHAATILGINNVYSKIITHAF